MTSRRDKANAIRALAMDAVQQAKSGHPGMPMGMADIAEVLWTDFLRHNPADPNWNMHGQSSLAFCLLAFPMSDSWRICLPCRPFSEA